LRCVGKLKADYTFY